MSKHGADSSASMEIDQSATATAASRKRKAGAAGLAGVVETAVDAGAGATGNGSSSSGGTSKENAAAARIQAMIRGAKARSAHKSSVLWDAWNKLDWKEEQALMNSHSSYQALKNAVTNRVKKEKESTSSSATSKKRPSSPSTKKGRGKAAAVNPDEEESACGLLLRDKDPLTFTWVSTMMEHFRQNKQLPPSLVFKLLHRAEPILRALPNIVDVNCTGRIIVVGDLHGQLDDLLAIFKLTGLPSSRNRYLFNGDFVDRGQHSVECILTLLAWKILMPNDVMLNRGNHEARDINGRDGFERECLQKYANNVDIFDGFSKVFATLPLIHILDSQVYVTHGGLFDNCPTLAEIQALDRFHEVPPSGTLMEYALWSDPKNSKGREDSPRGAGLLFGPEVTKEFLAKNNLSLIVRSHECMAKGYKYHHHDTVITVFSASNYTGTVGNDGALVIFEKEGTTDTLAIQAKKATPRSRAASPAPGHEATSTTASIKDATEKEAAPVAPRSPRLAAKQAEEAKAKALADAKAAAAPKIAPPTNVVLTHHIQPFYAAKKEKQSAYRVVGGSNLESEIITKLLHIISDRRLHLTDYWMKNSTIHSSGVRTVTRAQWAAGLKDCLSLTLPFLEFQDLLGLPKLGVDGQPKGPIDFMAFLARFRPVNLVVLRAQRARHAAASQSQQSQDQTQESQDQPMEDELTGPIDLSPDAVDPALASIESILELLHKNRFELESLFRYLDFDGDESISHDEFIEGIKSLEPELQHKFTKAQLKSLIDYIDVDGDGSISYSEFLNSFELSDPQFQTHLQRTKSIKDARSGATGASVRVMTNGHAPATTPTSATEDESRSHSYASDMETVPVSENESLSPRHSRDHSDEYVFPYAHLSTTNDLSDHDSTSTGHSAKKRKLVHNLNQ